MVAKRLHAFTLIELLVVIAIIGILAAVVLASLNIARERGREAAIRTTLKNAASEVELLLESNGNNYNFVNNCTASSSPLYKFVTALQAQGATTRCDSFNVSPDTFNRWAIAAVLVSNPLKGYSVSSSGAVSTWDAVDWSPGSAATWTNAMNACTSQGKRLPAAEELRALWKVTSPANPAPGFLANVYWSSTEVPGQESASAYFVYMSNGSAGSGGKGIGRYVRCVR